MELVVHEPLEVVVFGEDFTYKDFTLEPGGYQLKRIPHPWFRSFNDLLVLEDADDPTGLPVSWFENQATVAAQARLGVSFALDVTSQPPQLTGS